MENKLIEAIKEAFEIEDREVLLTDEFRNYPEWDSLHRLTLIVVLDEEFDLILEDKDFNKLNTLGDILDVIKNR